MLFGGLLKMVELGEFVLAVYSWVLTVLDFIVLRDGEVALGKD